MRPDFFIIGAAKSGTTSLFRYLSQHPQVFGSKLKEPTFFVSDAEKSVIKAHLFQPCATLEEYRRHFEAASSELAVGEASPLYLYGCDSAELIHDFNPASKIIAILRNPVDRAFSHFNFLRQRGLEPIGRFDEALSLEAERIRCKSSPAFHYMERGKYGAQLARYYDCFHRDRIRVYRFEKFASAPLVVLEDLFEFLGVDSNFVPDIKIKHNRLVYSPLAGSDRSRLMEHFRNDVLRLESLTGQDFSEWFSSRSLSSSRI